jgi:small redox-active disulfide protein 2
MSEVVQVRLGPMGTVGIVGLKETLAEVAQQMEGAQDDAIGEALLTRLSRQNYISDNVRDLYQQAFLREYKKLVGEPLAHAPGGGMEIKVLGRGCPQCERLEQELMEVMAETGIMADLEHVRDVAEIGRYGVLGTPALIINNEVKAVGAVPPRAKLKAWIEQAAKQNK